MRVVGSGNSYYIWARPWAKSSKHNDESNVDIMEPSIVVTGFSYCESLLSISYIVPIICSAWLHVNLYTHEHDGMRHKPKKYRGVNRVGNKMFNKSNKKNIAYIKDVGATSNFRFSLCSADDGESSRHHITHNDVIRHFMWRRPLSSRINVLFSLCFNSARAHIPHISCSPSL